MEFLIFASHLLPGQFGKSVQVPLGPMKTCLREQFVHTLHVYSMERVQVEDGFDKIPGCCADGETQDGIVLRSDQASWLMDHGNKNIVQIAKWGSVR